MACDLKGGGNEQSVHSEMFFLIISTFSIVSIIFNLSPGMTSIMGIKRLS